MKLVLINGNGTQDITHIVTSVTLSGEYRSCSRTLSFGLIKSQADKNTYTVPVNMGNNIQLLIDNEVLFSGIVWTKSKQTDANEIDIVCMDFGVYLNKNRGNYSFSKMTPGAIVKKICSDYGIQVGDIAAGGNAITRNFFGVRLYDIIMTAYTLSSDNKYMIIFKGQKLCVIQKGNAEALVLESSVNLLTSSVSETLDSMVNRVDIYNDKNVLVRSHTNENDIKLYGLMSEYIKATDSKTDYTIQAKNTLAGIDRKITVTNFGDKCYQTGKRVVVKEPYTSLDGIFYIDADEHSWKNGIYTNKLTLNFENMMDEKESGSNA